MPYGYFALIGLALTILFGVLMVKYLQGEFPKWAHGMMGAAFVVLGVWISVGIFVLNGMAWTSRL